MSSSRNDARAQRALGGLRKHETERDPNPVPERYTLGEEIGKGGMAVVHRARDAQLDRDVALKLLRDDFRTDPGDFLRFRREAETLARLSHPNVVTVFDAGDNFLVMELVKGRALDQVLASDPPDPRRVSEIMEKTARAVHAAHESDILHRDLKPSNILIAEDGEPKVADFGIAQLMGDITALTQSGMVLRTPQYMSPEQAEGRRRDFSPRTDVYALGAITYECLAGRPPHEGDTPLDVLRKIVNEEPPPLEAPKDLVTICMRALEKEPDRRYATALEFAHDLARWRDGLTIKARPVSALYRLRKRLAKRKAVMLGVGSLAALVVVLALVLPQVNEAKKTAELWGRISPLLSQAELASRLGQAEKADSLWKRGIAECRGFLREYDVADAHYFLGRLLHARGEDADATRSLDEALRLNPSLGEANLERGLIRIETYERAISRVYYFHAGLPPGSGSKEPKSGDGLEKEYPHLTPLRKAAIEDLGADFGQSIYFRDVDAKFGKAELARLRWEWDRARKLLNDILESESLYVQARLALAKLEMMVLNFREAIRHASQATEDHKSMGEAWLVLGSARLWKSESLGRSREAIDLRVLAERDLDQAVKLLRRNGLAKSARGSLRLRKGDFKAALADLDDAVALRPEDPVARNHRGVVRASLNDYKGAIEDFSKSIEFSKGYAMAWANRGKARAISDDIDGAIGDTEQALKLAPDNAGYRPELERFLSMLKSMKD